MHWTSLCTDSPVQLLVQQTTICTEPSTVHTLVSKHLNAPMLRFIYLFRNNSLHRCIEQVIAPKKQNVAPMHRFSGLFKNKSMHRRNKSMHRTINQLMHRSKFHRTKSCTWGTSDCSNRLLHLTTYTINKRVAPNNSSNILSSRKGISIGFFSLRIKSFVPIKPMIFLSIVQLIRTDQTNDFFIYQYFVSKMRVFCIALRCPLFIYYVPAFLMIFFG
jgi:hypothetical protein